MRRNIDCHTSVAEAERNIVAAFRKLPPRAALPMSSIGEAAFPGYSFKAPQGAALSVSRIVHGLRKRGVLYPSIGSHGYELSRAHRDASTSTEARDG